MQNDQLPEEHPENGVTGYRIRLLSSEEEFERYKADFLAAPDEVSRRLLFGRIITEKLGPGVKYDYLPMRRYFGRVTRPKSTANVTNATNGGGVQQVVPPEPHTPPQGFPRATKKRKRKSSGSGAAASAARTEMENAELLVKLAEKERNYKALQEESDRKIDALKLQILEYAGDKTHDFAYEAAVMLERNELRDTKLDLEKKLDAQQNWEILPLQKALTTMSFELWKSNTAKAKECQAHNKEVSLKQIQVDILANKVLLIEADGETKDAAIKALTHSHSKAIECLVRVSNMAPDPAAVALYIDSLGLKNDEHFMRSVTRNMMSASLAAAVFGAP